MMMNKKSVMTATLLGAALMGQAYAQAPKPSAAYWTDSSGTIWRDAYGDCWRSGSWTPETALPECERGMAAKVAAPAPAPAPVAAPAPAPAPAPVVAPAPAPAPAPKPLVEKTFRLEGANFATSSSRLLPGAGVKLDEVVNAAKGNPGVNLAVTGYTDSAGNADSNVKLSQARAEAVKAYLVSKGVAASRVSTAGKGAADPVADNATAEGRAKNRRVEVAYTVKQ